MTDGWYLRIRGKAEGPFDFEALLALKDRGKLHKSHKLSVNGDDWFAASELEGIFLQSTSTAPVSNAQAEVSEPAVAPTDEWWYSANDGKIGPVDRSVIEEGVTSRRLSPADLVWQKGMEEWKPVSEMPQFAEFLLPRENIVIEASRLRPVNSLTDCILWLTVLSGVLAPFSTGLVLSGDRTFFPAVQTLVILYLLVAAVRAILLLVSLYRLNSNARVLGAVDLEYSPAFTVWTFFIPIANLVLPCSAVLQIQKASVDPLAWRKQPSSGLVISWWITLILSLFASPFAFVVPWLDLPPWILAWLVLKRMNEAQLAHVASE